MLKKLLIVFGCLLGIAVNCYIKLPLLKYVVHGDNDFMGFYAAAKLAGSDELYSREAISREESKLWNTPRFLPVVRLPFYFALLSPLRAFSYQHAYWIWQSVMLAAWVGFVWFLPAPRKWVTALACCWSAPILVGFIIGQDVALILLVVAVSLSLLFNGRHFAAGCVFSFCLIKYNLFLPLPLLIVGKRLWRFGGGILAGGAVLLGISFVVGGWSWPWQYLAMLRLPQTTPSGYTANLHGIFSGRPNGAAFEIAAVCMALLGAWLVIRRQEIRHAIAAMLACGLLVSYHAFFADIAILVPVSLYLLGREAATACRMAGMFLLLPLAYLPFMLPNPLLPPSTVLLLPLLVLVVETIRGRRTPLDSDKKAPPALASGRGTS